MSHMQVYEKCIDECTCLSVCDMIFNGILEDALLIRQKIKFNRTYSYSLYGNLLNQTILNNVEYLWVPQIFTGKMYMWNEFYILFFHTLFNTFLPWKIMQRMTNTAFYHPSKLFGIFGTLTFRHPKVRFYSIFGQKERYWYLWCTQILTHKNKRFF